MTDEELVEGHAREYPSVGRVIATLRSTIARTEEDRDKYKHFYECQAKKVVEAHNVFHERANKVVKTQPLDAIHDPEFTPASLLNKVFDRAEMAEKALLIMKQGAESWRQQALGLTASLEQIRKHASVGHGAMVLLHEATEAIKDAAPILARHDAKVRAQAFEEAAIEAELPRLMILRREDIENGMLEDGHPVIKARAVMRSEIAKALHKRAAAERAKSNG